METTFIKWLSLMLLLCNSAMADSKFDVQLGGYSLNATTDRGSGQISSIGLYRLNYRKSFFSNIELGIGYSLTFAKIITGDIGYGPDFSMIYFPITNAHSTTVEIEQINFKSYDKFRPFISAGFHQRQYQSVNSGFAGFSTEIGAEVYFKNNIYWIASYRLLFLSGPRESKANELSFSIGTSYEF